MVSTRLYPGGVVVVADDAVVARHERLSDSDGTRYDWQHYIPLVQRKPGALRNGAPFADMPEALQRLRRGLLRQGRSMAQVLASVPTAGLDAVIVAVELSMEGSPPSGRVSVEHVVNVRSNHRRRRVGGVHDEGFRSQKEVGPLLGSRITDQQALHDVYWAGRAPAVGRLAFGRCRHRRLCRFQP